MSFATTRITPARPWRSMTSRPGRGLPAGPTPSATCASSPSGDDARPRRPRPGSLSAAGASAGAGRFRSGIARRRRPQNVAGFARFARARLPPLLLLAEKLLRLLHQRRRHALGPPEVAQVALVQKWDE